VSRLLAALALSVAAAGCQALTDFDTASIEETSAALCSDEIDNDGNGLTDCHDFGCLEQAACCTIPRLALEEEFAPPCAAQSCDAPDPACLPDPELWDTWGVPQPVLCEGALAPIKPDQCYDIGALGRAIFELEPGLRMVAAVVGAPEQRGRLELGFTTQLQIAGSLDSCASITTSSPVFSIRQLADVDGYRFVARFDQQDVALSPRFDDPDGHVVELVIDATRRVRYAVDGVEFGASPAAQPIPDAGLVGKLVLAGRGGGARIDRVEVSVGTECERPGAWLPGEPFEVAPPSGGEWDAFGMYAPALLADEAGGLELFYSGCGDRGGLCDELVAGFNRAPATAGLSFGSPPICSLVGPSRVVCADGVASPFADLYNNVVEAAPFRFGDQVRVLIAQRARGTELVQLALDDRGGVAGLIDAPADRIRAGGAGAWDSHEICCATALVEDGAISVWYAGRDGTDRPWQIGLARSTDGVRFAKVGDRPVLSIGDDGRFDASGVTAPTVLRDRGLYRMWYEGVGFFGATAIGYAVSTDGVRWHRFPGNPVVAPADLGLSHLRAPAAAIVGGRWVLLVSQDQSFAGSRIYGLVNQ
jgi:hypothetical protein